MAGRRRRLRPGHVLVTIQDLLILTWQLPLSEIRRSLPAGIHPWSQNDAALVSALLFRNRRLRPALLGWPSISCCQMNLRCYILDPVTGEPASVFFYGLFLGNRWLAQLSARAFGVPFQYMPLAVRAEREGLRLRHWEGATLDGAVRVRAREQDGPKAVDPEQLDLLTNPHSGYVIGRDRSLLGWSIWHRNQTLRLMTVDEATIQPFAEAGLPLGSPASAFCVDSVDYEVYLPAHR
jgi:hypothetical protein